ncbi:hypothetical protein [Shinella sp.]|uniref:hypothetical protein n=1 Tax=Shinella sp. TaxID=1870904 RepID=UPI0029A3E2BD|nr:hypothetical protein [Shinella sp.]MDX3977437.1 hypothetical protein [Shinella sp.]
MADYLWLLAVAGGAFVLGGVLVYAVLRQRPLTAREQDRQTQKVRQLYDKEGTPPVPASQVGTRQRSRTVPLILAAVFVLIGCAFGVYVAREDGTTSPSVEGKEARDAQPAGPADESALPGQD